MPDVVVIGAGMAGAATTWALARRGRSVLLVDRFARGHDRGSSHGAERIFQFGYTDPAYVILAQESLAGWRVLEAWPSFIQRGDPLAYGLGTADGLVKAGLHGIGPVIDPDDRPNNVPGAVEALEAYARDWSPPASLGSPASHTPGGETDVLRDTSNR